MTDYLSTLRENQAIIIGELKSLKNRVEKIELAIDMKDTPAVTCPDTFDLKSIKRGLVEVEKSLGNMKATSECSGQKISKSSFSQLGVTTQRSSKTPAQDRLMKRRQQNF